MKYCFTFFIVLILIQCSPKVEVKRNSLQTVCNPVNISYRFRPETNEISRREAADPTIIRFKGLYWLFASKSGGYWYSSDLSKWNFIATNEIPTEDYAPTAIVLADTVYLAVSSKKNNKVYKSSDLMGGHWISEDTLEHAVEDPCFFLDDDNRLFLYWGCSNINPLYGQEIDPKNFAPKGEKKELIFPNPTLYGWEVRGDYNTEYDTAPWLEGLWMNKHNGRYYLQYSAPGTLEKSYSDGLYVADAPLGPFALAKHNPFAYKPEGFACGAGHGSTIEDDYGNFWHLGTITVSVKQKFERRIGFYPAFFDEDGTLYTYTGYGDYPIIIPTKKVENANDLFPGWMLLSYKKPITVSSVEEGHDARNMCDENIRTYWAATSGSEMEWASIDLGSLCDVYALQINFAEHNTQLFGRVEGLRHRFVVEGSKDMAKWQTVWDQAANINDNTHAYVQLPEKVNFRYIRIKNVQVPDGNFSLSGFRIFGLGNGNAPHAMKGFQAKRDSADRRAVLLHWNKSEGATGYNISYGANENMLYHNYMVYEDSSVTIRSLNSEQEYYFNIEAFNENGITKSSILLFVP